MAEPSSEILLSAIHAVQAGVDNLRRDFGELRQETTQLRQETTQLRQDVDTLRQEQTRTRVEVMARIDRLQDDLTSMRDESFVTYARAERVERVSSDAIRSLSDELSGMHRQIRRLQEEVRTLRGEH